MIKSEGIDGRELRFALLDQLEVLDDKAFDFYQLRLYREHQAFIIFFLSQFIGAATIELQVPTLLL